MLLPLAAHCRIILTQKALVFFEPEAPYTAILPLNRVSSGMQTT